MQQENLKEFQIHRSLNRPDLVFGCERKPLYMIGLLSVILTFSALNIYLAIIGVALFCVGVFLLQKMAKADPFMSTVFLRSLKYKKYYPARATPFALGGSFMRK